MSRAFIDVLTREAELDSLFKASSFDKVRYAKKTETGCEIQIGKTEMDTYNITVWSMGVIIDTTSMNTKQEVHEFCIRNQSDCKQCGETLKFSEEVYIPDNGFVTCGDCALMAAR